MWWALSTSRSSKSTSSAAHPSLVREIQPATGQPDGGAQPGGWLRFNTQTQVIAVGVESGDEWKMLRHLGVHAGPGPWFAEPQRLIMPA